MTTKTDITLPDIPEHITMVDRAGMRNYAASAEPNTHIDDDAVDHFAAAMKDKLAQARAKGRHGWHECPPEDLSAMLRAHVEKGDPRDVANFCMFLWSLGHPISAAPVAQEPCARLHITPTDTYPSIDIEVLDGSLLQPSMSPVNVYAAQAQPAGDARRLADDTRIGILADSSYAEGMKVGYSMGTFGDEDRYQKTQTRLYAQIREARAELKAQPSGNSGELPSAQDREDAERWRYIRRKLCLIGNGDGTCAMRAVNLPSALPVWPDLGKTSGFFDAAIDAARTAKEE